MVNVWGVKVKFGKLVLSKTASTQPLQNPLKTIVKRPSNSIPCDIDMKKYKILKLEKRHYPVCPECGRHTIVGFFPPRDCDTCGVALTGNGSICETGKTHPIIWQGDATRSSLYCCNGETNCSYHVLFSELTTPLKEKK